MIIKNYLFVVIRKRILQSFILASAQSTCSIISSNINPRLTFSKMENQRRFSLQGRMGIEARVCRIEACSVKRCYRMDARLFEFLLSRSIVYANIEAVRDGNDHFGLHFFFFPPPILPPIVSLPYLFLFFRNVKAPDSSRWLRLKKGFLSLSLSVFSEHGYVSAKPAPSASRILKQNL